MRMIWLVLVACAGSGGRAESPISASHTGDSVAAPASKPTQTLARVGGENGAWIDVIIDGTSSLEMMFCKRRVENERHDGLRITRPLLRECAVEPLPEPPPSAVTLVVREELTQLDLVFAGAAVAVGDEPVVGVIVRATPLPDRRACDELLVRLEADDERRWIETQAATATFLDEELKRAIERQTKACAGTDELAKRDCETYTSQREIVEKKRATPEPRPVHKRTCRVR